MGYNWESLEDREERLKREKEKREMEKQEEERKRLEREKRKEEILNDPDESMDEIGIVETEYWPEDAVDEGDYEIIEFECTRRESLLLNEGFIDLVEIRGYRDAVREFGYHDEEVSEYDEADGIVRPSDRVEETPSAETEDREEEAEETTVNPEEIAKASKNLPEEKVNGAREFFKRMLERIFGKGR